LWWNPLVNKSPEKTDPLADGDKVELLVVDGADHFFRDLYAEEIADVVAERIGE